MGRQAPSVNASGCACCRNRSIGKNPLLGSWTPLEVGEIVDGVVGEVLRWLARLAIVVEQAGGAFSDAVVQA